MAKTNGGGDDCVDLMAVGAVHVDAFRATSCATDTYSIPTSRPANSIDDNVICNGEKDVKIADMNNDGFNDVLVSCSDAHTVIILINKIVSNPGTELAQSDFTQSKVLEEEWDVSYVNFADFDNDGVYDVIAAGNTEHGNGAVVVFSPLTNKRKERTVDGDDLGYSKSKRKNVQAAVACDVDQDGWMDLVLLFHKAETVVWAKNVPAVDGRTFANPIQIELFTGDIHDKDADLQCKDLTGDGFPDIVVSLPEKEQFKIIENDKNNFVNSDTYTKSSVGQMQHFELVDLDGDGMLDILWADFKNKKIKAMWNGAGPPVVCGTEEAPPLVDRYKPATCCPEATYSDGGGCSPCPAGRYGDVTGLSSCTECQASKYRELEGASTCSTCDHPAVVNAAKTACADCPDNTFVTDESDSRSCSSCTAGYYLDRISTPIPTCTACSNGKKLNAEDQPGTVDVCQNCPAGRTSYGEAPMGCNDCGGGRYSETSASVSCTDCSPGSYTSNSRATACSSCPTGKYTEKSAETSCDGLCQPGKRGGNNELTEPRTSDSDACVDCVAGKYQAAEGVGFCKDCKADTFSSTPGADACTGCAEGKASGPGATECGGMVIKQVSLHCEDAAVLPHFDRFVKLRMWLLFTHVCGSRVLCSHMCVVLLFTPPPPLFTHMCGAHMCVAPPPLFTHTASFCPHMCVAHTFVWSRFIPTHLSTREATRLS